MLAPWLLCSPGQPRVQELHHLAGLKTALTRGNWAEKAGSTPSFQHIWNELFLDDGRRVLVDEMIKGSRQSFPELSSPEVADPCLKVDSTPWYTLPAGR